MIVQTQTTVGLFQTVFCQRLRRQPENTVTKIGIRVVNVNRRQILLFLRRSAGRLALGLPETKLALRTNATLTK